MAPQALTQTGASCICRCALSSEVSDLWELVAFLLADLASQEVTSVVARYAKRRVPLLHSEQWK
eukprot:4408083-Amphidinium_carterae.1